MDAAKLSNFIVGDDLVKLIEAQTNDGKFQRRDFVEPLVDFCLDGNFTARIGIVYGLRSTGKTVGMLHAAQELTGQGVKAAYARFNYEETGIRDVNAELLRLAKEGFTHFFLDEASYLGGFLNASAEWADTFVPIHRAKIIISGTDSFLLWLAQGTSLFHRYVPFQANWVSYPEWRRVIGQSFDDYKTGGGIFTAESMPDYIRTALAENLIHSLEHYFDDAGRTNEYTSRLYGIDEAVIYKAIISILKCAVDADVKRNFIQTADEKTIVELGTAISEWSAAEKRDIKERVAEALDVYKDFEGIKNPKAAIEALVQFLVKTGCLTETVFGISEYRDSATAYTFAHNALMNYSLQETIHGILKLENIDHPEFDAAIRQAAAGTINESIVFAHVLKGAGKDDKVFKYRDLDNREIDIVSINREAKTLWLIEVKSKSSVNPASVFHNEAKNLFSPEILKNMGADNSFRVVRALVYGGKSNSIVTKEKTLLCANIEEFLAHFKDLEQYLGKFSARAKEIYDSKY